MDESEVAQDFQQNDREDDFVLHAKMFERQGQKPHHHLLLSKVDALMTLWIFACFGLSNQHGPDQDLLWIVFANLLFSVVTMIDFRQDS